MPRGTLPILQWFIKQNSHRRVWKQIVGAMAAIVVFCTTYSLILPALTLEQQCEIEEHTHSESCYVQLTTREERAIVCTAVEDGTILLHNHGELCYDGEKLLCPLEEREAHAHGDDCFAPPEGHVHGDECYTLTRELSCGLEVTAGHSHTDGCYIQETGIACGMEETEDHSHGDDCNGPVSKLNCGLEETPAHDHTEQCYSETKTLNCQALTLSCAKAEYTEHTHTDGCYTEGSLTCEVRQVISHAHTEACIQTRTVELDTTVLTCTLEEGESHTHGNLCYGIWELVCTQEEHSHSSHALMVAEESDVIAMALDDQFITVETVNHYIPGKVMLIDGYTVSEFNNAAYNNTFAAEGTTVAMNADAKASFVNNQPALQDYTALIIENMQIGDVDGKEYYVDAVIRSSASTIMNPGVTMTNLAPKTSQGFVVYIPNSLISADNFPSRGDFVDPDFWHGTINVIAGYNQRVGQLKFIDNPTTAEVLTAATPANLNATVKIFDYGRSMNASHPNEFQFWNGDYGFGADIESHDGWGSDFILVNGSYVGAWPLDNPNISKEAYHGYNKFPTMTGSLSADGYPVIKDKNPRNAGNPVELDYLFDGTYQHGSTMSGGGGLFQKDEEGYYYYDSLQNAAYFNGSSFTLYRDLIVRPWPDSNDSSDQAYGNFLPLNPITTGNITLDSYYNWSITKNDNGGIATATATATGWPGSLQHGSGQSALAAAKTLEEDGNNRLKTSIYNTGKYAARLEEKVNLWFGMTVDFEFYQPENGLVDSTDDGVDNPKDMIFDFHGDDDVLVYVGLWDDDTQKYDYRLVLDLSGVHEARSGNINFATGAVYYEKHNADTGTSTATIPGTDRISVNTDLGTIFGLEGTTFADYSKLSIKFFYLERGGNISYCRLRFNMPTLPDKSLTVTKRLENGTADDALTDYIGDNLLYGFRVARADAEGKATAESYFQKDLGEGTYAPELVSYDLLENGKVISQGTVDETGTFYLKPGQSAQFHNMLRWSQTGTIQYVVQELIPDSLTGQYNGVDYAVGATTGTTITDSELIQDFTTYDTAALDPANSQYIIYRNKVDVTKLSTLQLTKHQAANTTLDPEQEFAFQVLLNGAPIPDGTGYTVGETAFGAETVTLPLNGAQTAVSGVVRLKVGQTAVLTDGILSGTAYTVREILPDGSGLRAEYSGTVTSDGRTEDLTGTEGITGTFPLGSLVHITVANADYACALELPLEKTYVGNTASEAEFHFDIVQVDQSGEPLPDAPALTGTTIRVSGDAPTSGKIVLKYDGQSDGTYYYKITERPGQEPAIYDDRAYLVEVLVEGNTASIVAVSGSGYEGGALSFRNRKLTEVTIRKTVSGATPPQNLTFDFTTTITDSDGSAFCPASGDGYTVAADGTVSFSLAHGASVTIPDIPVGAVITLAETGKEGYITSIALNGGAAEAGSSAQITVTDGLEVEYINLSCYALPETGGIGTAVQTMAGAALMLFSLVCLLPRRRIHP